MNMEMIKKIIRNNYENIEAKVIKMGVSKNKVIAKLYLKRFMKYNVLYNVELKYLAYHNVVDKEGNFYLIKDLYKERYYIVDKSYIEIIYLDHK